MMRIFKNKFFVGVLALLMVWILLSLVAPQMLMWVNVTNIAEDGIIEYTVTNISAWPSNNQAPIRQDYSRLDRLTAEGQWETYPSSSMASCLVTGPHIIRRLPVIRWSNTTFDKKQLTKGETYRFTIILQRGNRTIEISDEFVA